MQKKTIFALFCTIIVLLIKTNDGAPTGSKPAVQDKESSDNAPQKPKQLPGARVPWKKNLDAKSKKIFETHKAIVVKKLNAVHKVPTTFNPVPAKYSTQVVSGILYHYLVQIPSKKYAHVTIAHRPWRKEKAVKEDNVTVREQLYGLNDKML